MRFLPKARSGKWWLIAGCSTLLVSLFLWMIRFGLLEQPLSGTHLFRFFLLAFLLSLVLGIAGWLGARRLWLLSNAGMAAGLILMARSSGERNGWEDLAGFMAFLELTAAGFAAGLLAELVWLVFRRMKRA